MDRKLKGRQLEVQDHPCGLKNGVLQSNHQISVWVLSNCRDHSVHQIGRSTSESRIQLERVFGCLDVEKRIGTGIDVNLTINTENSVIFSKSDSFCEERKGVNASVR